MAAVEAGDLERGPWLDELVRIWKRDDELDPKVVAVEARNPESPLYPYFTHDASEARDRLNVIEAGVLIRRARVLISVEGGETYRMRTFVSTSDRKYQPATTLSKAAVRADVLDRLRADIERLEAKYQRYQEIAAVGDAMKQLRRWLKAHGG